MSTATTFKDPTKHVNGTVEVTGQACNSCHGDAAGTPTVAADQAPPVDVHGNVTTGQKGVGAHQQHLDAAGMTISAPFACATCHVVPATVDAAGHLDSAAGDATVTFGGLAIQASVPAYSAAALTCSATYCHGNTLVAAGTNETPKWTIVDGSQDACGTCHGVTDATLPRPHPTVLSTATCATCHAPTMTSSTAFRDVAKHVNGMVDIGAAAGQLSCNGVCHGSATGTSPANQAPPVDIRGLSATTGRPVGDHQKHLLASSNLSNPIACNECHPVPTAVPDGATPRHMNRTTDVDFKIGTLSKKVATTAYSTTAGTCTTSYCHGGWTSSGATTTSESWTDTTSIGTCTSRCHGLPPRTGEHAGSGFGPGEHNVACGRCHSTVASTTTPNAITAAGKANHVNGAPNVAPVSSSGTAGNWSTANRTCTSLGNGCHGSSGDYWGPRVLP
jgi:predicted CxxxxCH...CXXCH cytochrome family protein